MSISVGPKRGGSKYLYAPFDDTEVAFQRAEERLSSLEAAFVVFSTERAVNEEKQKRLETRFMQIDKRLDRVDALIARLVWLIVTAIIGGFMSFLMKGNLFGV